MNSEPKPENRTQIGGELRTLIKYFIMTAVTTGLGLVLRYALLCFRGEYDVSLLGINFTVNVNDNLAYTVYYISSIIFFYLWKWFDQKDRSDTKTFVVRFLGYCAVCGVSTVAGNILLSVLLDWGIHGEVAFWLTCPLTFLINYLGGRLIVFRDMDDHSAQKQAQPEEVHTNGGEKFSESHNSAE